MGRKVTCVMLGPDAEGLDRPPYPGALGQRIYENVSKLAWQRWLKHQTMLINEYRLTPIEPKARKFLEGEMEKFFLDINPRPGLAEATNCAGGLPTEFLEADRYAVTCTVGVGQNERTDTGIMFEIDYQCYPFPSSPTVQLRNSNPPHSYVTTEQSVNIWDDEIYDSLSITCESGSVINLSVVDAERLLDLSRRANIQPGSRLSQDDVLRLAHEAGVWTATLGSVAKLGDSLVFTVKAYDVGSRSQLVSARAAVADTSDVQEAFRQLASQILEVSGAPTASLLDVEPPTRSLSAYRAYIEGIQERSRWNVDSAIALFRKAVAADPTFALAYYELSQALAWTERTNPNPTYVGFADSALRYSTNRPPRERRLLEGFHALMHADIPRAREIYSGLIRDDSLNADAWGWYAFANQLDLTLNRDASGRERLPADYTAALHAYSRALQLDGSDHRFYLNLGLLMANAASMPMRR